MEELGAVSTFSTSEDDYETYCQILDQFFESEESGYLMSSIGCHIYMAVKGLLYPESSNSETLNEVSDMLSKQFGPKDALLSDISSFEIALEDLIENVYELYGIIMSLSEDCKFCFELGTILMFTYLNGTKYGQLLEPDFDEDLDNELQEQLEDAFEEYDFSVFFTKNR